MNDQLLAHHLGNLKLDSPLFLPSPPLALRTALGFASSLQIFYLMTAPERRLGRLADVESFWSSRKNKKRKTVGVDVEGDSLPMQSPTGEDRLQPALGLASGSKPCPALRIQRRYYAIAAFCGSLIPPSPPPGEGPPCLPNQDV